MASKITRYLREFAEATTDSSRHALRNRMAGITDRVSNLADRLRNGKAGRMISNLMDRFRGDDNAPRSRRRSAGKAAPRSSRTAVKGSPASRAAGSRDSVPRSNTTSSASTSRRQASSLPRSESGRPESAAPEKRSESSRASPTSQKGSGSRAARSRATEASAGSSPRTASRTKKEPGTPRNRPPH